MCLLQMTMKIFEAGSPYLFTRGLNKGFSLYVYTSIYLCLTQCIGQLWSVDTRAIYGVNDGNVLRMQQRPKILKGKCYKNNV